MESISEEFKAYYEAQLREHVCLPEKITARYRVAACLCTGEEKDVYRLLSLDTRCPYVLRQLPLRRKHSNETECTVLRGLDHPRIPKAVELFEEGGFSYFIRSYIEGISLHELVKSRGTLDTGEILTIAIELCDILTYLHAQNPPVIHRDIKPQNIICTEDGKVSLIDFDISRKYDPGASQDTIFIGTSVTAPPEQFGFSQTDVRSDIYAVGILLIFLFTGQYDRAAVRSLPPRLSKIVQKCTQFAPRDRYASAVQLRRALRAAQQASIRFAARTALIVIGFAASFALGYLLPNRQAMALAPTLSPSPASTVQPVVSPAPQTSVADDGTVSFASRQIEQNVRTLLHKTSGEPIKREELDQIIELCIVGNSTETNMQSFRFEGDRILADGKLVGQGELQTLTDLTLFTNLSNLQLINQRIRDLSPLKGLSLTTLNIEGNFVSDLSPLDSMPTLMYLFASRNPIRDLSPISTLPSLRRLTLQKTNTFDISPLAKVQTLESVDLFDIPCADYSPLLSLPLLESLNVSDSSVRDVEVVSGIKRLRELYVHRCRITDLAIFKELKNLERLELWQNEIKDLSGIEALSKLRSLNLNYTPVEDLSPLLKLPHLEELDLHEVRADLKPLLKIPSLKTIRCSQDMRPQIDLISKQAHFTIEIE